MAVLNNGPLTGILYLLFLKFKVGTKRLREKKFVREACEDVDNLEI